MEVMTMAKTKEGHLSDILLYYTAAENGYTEYKDVFYKLLDIYRGELDKELIEDLAKRGKSHIQYKKARAITNRFAATVKGTYFTNDQFANIIAADITEEAEHDARMKQDAFDYHWKHTIRPYKPFNMCIMDAGIYGTPIAKVYYNTVEDTPKMEHVSVHDCWFDPDAVDIEDCRFIVHRMRKSKQDISVLKSQGIYSAVFDVNTLSNDETAYISGTEDTPHKRLTIYDIYYKDKGKWYLSTMSGKSTLLRQRVLLNDGQPFIVGSIMEQMYDDREKAVRMYGDTFLSAIDTMQQEMTSRINQQLDAIALNISPKYFTETSTGMNDADMRSGAGRQVRLTNIALKDMIPPPPVPMLNADIDRLALQMEESTGIKSFSTQDTALVNRQSAHGMEILSADSNVMVDSYVRSFNETFAEPLVARFVELIWKHSQRSHLFLNVARTNTKNFFVSINAGLGSTSKSVKIEGNDKLFQQFMAVQDVENAKRIIKDTLPLYGKKNVTQYFPTSEKDKKAREEMEAKMQQLEEQRMQLQMADAEAKIKEAEAQAQMHLAMAEDASVSKDVKLAKTRAEIDIMYKDFELRAREFEHKADIDFQTFDMKDRELSMKELEGLEASARGEAV